MTTSVTRQAGVPLLFLGVDLAWTSAGTDSPATGVTALRPDGLIVDAGLRHGPDQVLMWMQRQAGDDRDVLAFVDAPLVVNNETGMRECEKEVGRNYHQYLVAANPSNLSSPRLAGVEVRERLEEMGWQYHTGLDGPPTSGRWVAECYPYTTLVGAEEFGYDEERPTYKRRPKSLDASAPEWRRIRAEAFDEIAARMAEMRTCDPPLDLDSHLETSKLHFRLSPHDGNRRGALVKDIEADYKAREDLLDAVICAWTASLWSRHGTARCQVLGADAPGDPPATIIAPYRAS